MADTDVNLRAVPSDADPDDVRLYVPGQADAAAPGGAVPLRMFMGVGT